MNITDVTFRSFDLGECGHPYWNSIITSRRRSMGFTAVDTDEGVSGITFGSLKGSTFGSSLAARVSARTRSTRPGYGTVRSPGGASRWPKATPSPRWRDDRGVLGCGRGRGVRCVASWKGAAGAAETTRTPAARRRGPPCGRSGLSHGALRRALRVLRQRGRVQSRSLVLDAQAGRRRSGCQPIVDSSPPVLGHEGRARPRPSRRSRAGPAGRRRPRVSPGGRTTTARVPT